MLPYTTQLEVPMVTKNDVIVVEHGAMKVLHGTRFRASIVRLSP